jgi:hypothetical protein
MTEIVHSMTFKITEDGKFVEHPGQVVGRVLPNGRVENTSYQFPEGSIGGGVAITKNATLERVDEETLINPATLRRFNKTRKGTGYFSRIGDDKVFIKDYYQELEDRYDRED